jgi:hypothetical protein
MRWMKHMTAARNNEVLSELLEFFGAEGYGVWWIILELIGAQMDKSDKCSARYSIKKWSKSCHVSPKKFQKVVSFLSKLEQITAKVCTNNSDFMIIECRKLLKFRDEYSRKSGHTPDKLPKKSGATPVQETETETDIYSEDSKEFRLSLFLLNNIRKRKPDFKIPNLQKWAVQSDYILRIDKRDIEEVKNVIAWIQKDEFWQDNILSTAKLRKQYDKLVLKMNKVKPFSQPATLTAIPGAVHVKNLH